MSQPDDAPEDAPEGGQLVQFPGPPEEPQEPDTEPVLVFEGYYKGLISNPSGDGEITLKVGVPNEWANAAWPIRQLNGFTLRFEVYQP